MANAKNVIKTAFNIVYTDLGAYAQDCAKVLAVTNLYDDELEHLVAGEKDAGGVVSAIAHTMKVKYGDEYGDELVYALAQAKETCEMMKNAGEPFTIQNFLVCMRIEN